MITIELKKPMKKLTITSLFFFQILSFNICCASSVEARNYGLADSTICPTTYVFDLIGNVNPITSKQITDYIMHKKGICEANINVFSKKITVRVSDEIDVESIRDLITYAGHLFLLEEDHSETFEK